MNITYRNKYTILLIFLVLLSVIVPAYADKNSNSHDIIAYLNIYSSSGDTDYGFYRINPETLERNVIMIPGSNGLTDVQVSSDGRFALGKKLNRDDFTRELFLVNIEEKNVVQLTSTPPEDRSKPPGTFEDFDFSPDNRFAVICFPDGVRISERKKVPFSIKDASCQEYTAAFIDIEKWLKTYDENAIVTIKGNGRPVFSPSSKRFIVPLNTGKSEGSKIMVYEISNAGNENSSPFFGYELPFVNVYQSTFATDNQIYLLNNDELILYDLIGSRIMRSEMMTQFTLRGFGYAPENIPDGGDISEGPICFGGNRFAFVSAVSDYPNLNKSQGDTDDSDYPGKGSISEKRSLLIAYGETQSDALRWMKIPPLPDEAYREDQIYHRMYFPDGNEDIAVLHSGGWQYQVFRIVDFRKKLVVGPVQGFFLGMSADKKGLIYIQCGENNSDRYKGTNHTWETIIQKGIKVGVKSNRLYYLDLETNVSHMLVKIPSHTNGAIIMK